MVERMLIEKKVLRVCRKECEREKETLGSRRKSDEGLEGKT